MKYIFKNFYVKIYFLFMLATLITALLFVFSKETLFLKLGVNNLYLIIVLYGLIVPVLTIENKLIDQVKFGVIRKQVFIENLISYFVIASFVIIYELVIFIMQFLFDYIYIININLLFTAFLSFLVFTIYGDIIGLSNFNKYLKIVLIILFLFFVILFYFLLQNFINILLIIIFVLFILYSLKTYKIYLVKE